MNFIIDIEDLLIKMEQLIENDSFENKEELRKIHREVVEKKEEFKGIIPSKKMYEIEKRLSNLESEFETDEDIIESSLDYMFPNRDDDDFDQDDISYNNVFND